MSNTVPCRAPTLQLSKWRLTCERQQHDYTKENDKNVSLFKHVLHLQLLLFFLFKIHTRLVKKKIIHRMHAKMFLMSLNTHTHRKKIHNDLPAYYNSSGTPLYLFWVLFSGIRKSSLRLDNWANHWTRSGEKHKVS